MIDYSLELKNLGKIFGRRVVFRNLDYHFTGGQVIGISGKNGSGKSTLLKIIAGIISPSTGKVIHSRNSSVISSEDLHNNIGFVSPYLSLYEEFSAEENIEMICKIRGIKSDKEKIKYYLDKFTIYDRRNDLLKGYSSGMLQRVKFVFALIHNPSLLLFDEPTSNLDNAGKQTVYEIIRDEGKEKLIILASNEDDDLALCNKIIKIEEYKNR